MLRLSQSALSDVATGLVVNLMANDVHRFDQALMYTHFIWISPIQTVFMGYFMYESMGVAVFGGIALIIFQGGLIQSKLSLSINHGVGFQIIMALWR